MSAFTIHNQKSAPEKSREILAGIENKMGLVPNVLGEIAESPALLKGYSELWAATSWGSFSPAEQQIVQMTVSSMNNCSYCIAAHTTLAEKDGVPREILEALRKEKPLKDPKLEALRIFTRSLMKKMGRADENDLKAFYKAGYTKAHVFEVILGVSLKTITNYVNHIAETPLDKAFEPNRVEDRKPDQRSSNAA